MFDLDHLIKHFRQVMWHFLPMSVVFLIVLGIQLFVITFMMTVLILLFAGDGDFFGPNAGSESVGALLIILFNALLPCAILFPIALILDKLTRNRAIWLNIILPLPFILASAGLAFLLLFYFSTETPGIAYAFWLSLIDKLVIFLIALAAILALFVPYWYILQVERLLVWSVRRIRL